MQCQDNEAAHVGPKDSNFGKLAASPWIARATVVTESIENLDDEVAFGPFLLSPARRTLIRDGQPLSLGSRSFEILCVLIEQAGNVVSKEEITARVWPGIFTGEGNLRVQVAGLRKCLGDGHNGQRYILNVSNRGYSFVQPVRRIARKVRDHRPVSLASIASHHFPVIQSRVIGRKQASLDLAMRIFEHRLVTLVGAGGVGKTTLAVSTVSQLLDRPEAVASHSVYFVDLAPLSDPRLVSSALATALGVGSLTDETLQGIISYLGDKDLLLLFDNCEHVVDEIATIAGTILCNTPRVRILATSREPLRVDGEWVQHLQPLTIPTAQGLSAAEAITYPAVELFVERVQARSASFMLRDEDIGAVVGICQRLDGIPLAIEMAAGRTDSLGVRGLAATLEHIFAVLTKGRRTALLRHQTLAAALDWSFNLLDSRDQAVFQRLSVFAGAFTMEAALAVAAWGEYGEPDVVESLCDLVDQSLITSIVSGDNTFFRFLETTRAYARQKLASQPDAVPMAKRHAEYCQSILVESEVAWARDDAHDWHHRFGWLIDDVRAALNWAFAPRGDRELGVSITINALPLWFQQSLINECRARIDQALATLSLTDLKHDRTAMRLHTARAFVLSATPGRSQETALARATAYEIAERLGDTDYLLRNLLGIWAGKMIEADFQSARQAAERFCVRAIQTSDPSDSAVGERLLGVSLHFLGDQEGALYHAEQMRNGYRVSSRRAHVVRYQFDQIVTANIGRSRTLWMLGLGDQALRALDAGIEDAMAIGHKLSLCNTLMQAACPVALLAGDLARAERFTEILRRESEQNGLGVWHLFVGCFRGQILIKQGEVAEGLALIRTAIEKQQSAGHHQYYLSFKMAYAEGLAVAGFDDEAIAELDTALAHSAGNEEHWATAEILRLKGEVIGRAGDARSVAIADEHFNSALEIAIQQKALFWQIRTATSIARLRRTQGRSSEGRDLLSAVYNAFTEGHDLYDLRTANSLLHELFQQKQVSSKKGIRA